MQNQLRRAATIAAVVALTAPAAASAHTAHAARLAPKTWCAGSMCAVGHRHKRHVVVAVAARKMRVA
jgi:hypothetical protein